MHKLKKLIAPLAASTALVLAAAAVSANGAGGVDGPAFYVDGQEYRTVATPTDLSGTGAPDHSFDTIYAVGGGQLNVAEAAPGDTHYNGGRWKVVPLSYNTDYATTVAAHDSNGSGDLDSAEEVESALADMSDAGATAGDVIKSFECPVIPFPKGK